jgi:hypothetical protein
MKNKPKGKKFDTIEAITYTSKNSRQLYLNSMSQNVVAKG